METISASDSGSGYVKTPDVLRDTTLEKLSSPSPFKNTYPYVYCRRAETD